MPEDRARRPRGWAIAVAGFVAIAGYFVATRVVLAPERAGMASTVGWVASELFAVAMLWSVPAFGSFALRAAITTCVGVPLVFVVGFFGLFGDAPLQYSLEPAPAALHVVWLFWAIVWALVAGILVPAMLVIYDAIAQFARRE